MSMRRHRYMLRAKSITGLPQVPIYITSLFCTGMSTSTFSWEGTYVEIFEYNLVFFKAV